MSARTVEKDRTAESAGEDHLSSAEEVQPVTRDNKNRKGSKQHKRSKKKSMQLDQVADVADGVNDLASRTGSGVTNTMGNVANTALENQDELDDDDGRSDTLRLRLDLNLDIEIQLKARIHGDLELALLD